MAKFNLIPSVKFEVHMILTEEQARALSEVTCYNIKDTVDKIMGTSTETILSKYRKDLTGFLEDCRDNINPQLKKIDASKKALSE